MNATKVPPARVRTAVALSIAAHLCAFCLLAALLDDRPTALSSALEADPALTVTTIEHRSSPLRRRPAAPATLRIVPRALPAATRTAPPASPQSAARTIVRPIVAPAAAVPAAGQPPRRAAPQAPSGPARLSLALVLPSPTVSPTAIPTVAAATPVPTSAPTPAPSPIPSAAVAANFGGLFSQNYPPELATPSELAALHARLDSPVRIRIDVDETGHATDVHFISAVANPALEGDIRSELLALHYVPADCNGLHCEGTLEIRY